MPVWLPWLAAPFFMLLPIGGCGVATRFHRPAADQTAVRPRVDHAGAVPLVPIARVVPMGPGHRQVAWGSSAH